MKCQNPKSHKSITRSTRVILTAVPTITNTELSDIVHNEFKDVRSDEVIRSMHLAIWAWNNAQPNLKRNYKNL